MFTSRKRLLFYLSYCLCLSTCLQFPSSISHGRSQLSCCHNLSVKFTIFCSSVDTYLPLFPFEADILPLPSLKTHSVLPLLFQPFPPPPPLSFCGRYFLFIIYGERLRYVAVSCSRQESCFPSINVCWIPGTFMSQMF